MSTAVAEAPGLSLSRAMKWMFASPNWVANLFWVFLCALLGSVMIGSFVLVGYQMDIIQRRSRGGENTDVDFDANRFAEYLVRGLIPAAIYLVVTIVLGAIVGLLVGIWAMLFSALVGPDPDGLMALVMIGPILVLVCVMIGATLFIALPLAVRAGLCNDLSEGLKINWALETAMFMWPVMLLLLLYLVICSFISMLGFLACFVGIYVTSAWLQLVMADMGAQLYDVYLWKGGKPLPMHGETLQAEMV